MLNIALAALLPLLAHAEAPATDIRTFSSTDMAELAGKISQNLHKCKELANGGTVEINFINSTSEAIDKDAFVKAIQGQLAPGTSEPGRKYDLQVKLASLVKQTGQDYEGTYTLNAHLKQGDEMLCLKSAKIVKKGTVAK